MKKNLLALLLLVGGSIFSQVQLNREKNENVKHEPEWVQKMYQDYPNLEQVKDLYEEYYINHEFKKNYNTQYYKELVMTYELYMKENGEIDFDLFNKQFQNEVFTLEKNQNVRSAINAKWEDIGLGEVYNNSTKSTPHNSNVFTVAQSETNPQVLYAGTEGGGLWKTADKGRTWIPVGQENLFSSVTSVSVNPKNENIVLAGTDGGLYRTSNGGNTWIKVLNVGFDAIEFSKDAKVVFAARRAKNGFYKSSDGGINWALVSTDIFYDIKAHPTDTNILYAIKFDSDNIRAVPLRSDNKGSTWKEITNTWYMPSQPTAGATYDHRKVSGARIAVTNAAPNNVYIFVVGNATPGAAGQTGLFFSNNKGNSWRNLLGKEGGPYKDVNFSSPKDPNGPLYLVGYNSGYYQGYYNLDLEVSPTDPNDIYLGNIFCYKTNDLGKTFTRINTGHSDQQWYLFDKIEKNIMWTATDGGLVRYDINTDTYDNIEGIRARYMWGFSQAWNEDLWGGGAYHNGDAVSREGYPKHSGAYLGGAESYTGVVNPINNLGYFRDLGSNFYELPEIVTERVKTSHKNTIVPNGNRIIQSNRHIEWHPYYFESMYEGAGNSLWFSKDLGRTFDEIKDFGENVSQVVVSRVDPSVLLVATKNTIYKSGDNGESWTKLNFPAGYSKQTNLGIELSGTDIDRMWLYNKYRVYQTNNGGSSWNEIKKPTGAGNIQSLVHQLGTDETIYLATGNNVYVRNSGNNWIEYNQGLPAQPRIFAIEPFYRDEKLRMAGTRGVWSTPMQSSSSILAQPSVAKQLYRENDSIQFDSYSVVKADGVTWEWAFPGASYVSSVAVRNPIVRYDVSGKYDATLTVTDAKGRTSTKTIKEIVWIRDTQEIKDVVLADTYIRGGRFSSENFGDDTEIFLKNISGGLDYWDRLPYYKLDISSINLNKFNEDIEIILSIKGDIAATSIKAQYVQDNSWIENTITTNNHPVAEGEMTNGSTVSKTEADINITELVKKAKADGKDELSLTLNTSNDSSYSMFFSKESDKKPSIKILGSYETPEPRDFIKVKNIVLDDSYVRGSRYSNDNFGSDKDLFLKNDGTGNYYRRPFIKVDLSNMEFDKDSEVKLVMPIQSLGNSEIDVYVQKVTQNDWNEMTITNNNIANFNSSIISENKVVRGEQEAVLDITKLALEAYNKGESILSLTLFTKQRGGSNYVVFHSKEGVQKPYIKFTGEYFKDDVLADSYVRGGSFKNNNYGTERTLVVKNDGNSSYYRESILRLDIKDLNVENIPVVELKLPINEIGATLETAIYEVENDWDETKVKYDNSPLIISETIVDKKQIDGSMDAVFFDIRSLIIKSKNEGKEQVSVVIRSLTKGSSNWVAFNSKENEREKPSIVLSGSNSPLADTYLRGGKYLDTNFGDEATFIIKNNSGAYYRDGLLKFNSSHLEVNNDEQVYLVLPINSIERNLEVEIYSVLESSWKENTVTKKSSPTFSDEPILTVPVDGNNKELKINVTELVKNAENDLFSIALNVKSHGSRDYIIFYSKEIDNENLRPHLEISKETFSHITRKVQIENTNKENTLSVEVYPTYFDQNLNLKLKNIEGEVYIQIYDIHGRLVSKNNRMITPHKETLDLSQMIRGVKSGHYIITIICNGMKKNSRIYKK